MGSCLFHVGLKKKSCEILAVTSLNKLRLFGDKTDHLKLETGDNSCKKKKKNISWYLIVAKYNLIRILMRVNCGIITLSYRFTEVMFQSTINQSINQ